MKNRVPNNATKHRHEGSETYGDDPGRRGSALRPGHVRRSEGARGGADMAPQSPGRKLVGEHQPAGNTNASPANGSERQRKAGENKPQQMLCAACTNIASTLGAASLPIVGAIGASSMRRVREATCSSPCISGECGRSRCPRGGIIVLSVFLAQSGSPLKLRNGPRALYGQGHPLLTNSGALSHGHELSFFMELTMGKFSFRNPVQSCYGIEMKWNDLPQRKLPPGSPAVLSVRPATLDNAWLGCATAS